MDPTLKQLVGTWSLERVTQTDSEGRVTDHYQNIPPSGQLVYTEEGFMAVVIVGDGEGSPGVSYAGTVSAEGGVVWHHVRVGIAPFTGDQMRYARLEGDDRLVLASDKPGQPHVELSWARLSPEQ